MTDNAFIYENHHLNDLVSRLYTHMHAYGYEHVQVPAIADVDLFLKKSGDQIIEHLFTFERFGRNLALRPEFTALAAHRYATAHPTGDRVVRWQFNGSVFQENHDARRYQQMSFGAELIGANSPLADAEVVAMSASGLSDVVGVDDLRLSIGHVGLLRRALARFGLDERTEQFLLTQIHGHDNLAAHKSDVMDAFDEQFTVSPGDEIQADAGVLDGTQQMLDVMLDATQMGQTMGGRSRLDIVRRMVRKANRALQRDQVRAALDFLADWTAARDVEALRALTDPEDAEFSAMLDEFETFITLLNTEGIAENMIDITPVLVRDWNYYTGLVFQFTDAQGVRLGGGGRYDELVQLLGAEANVPAIGFAYYLDDILSAHQPDAPTTDANLLHLDATNGSPSDAILWANTLRASGYSVVVHENEPILEGPILGLKPDGTLTYKDQSYAQDASETLTNQLKDA